MKTVKKIKLLLFSLVFYSCTFPVPMSYTALGSFEQGEPAESFFERVELEPLYNYKVLSKLNNKNADVYVYQDNFYNANTYDLDVFIFIDQKLYAWGRIDDLKKHPKEDVRQLMKDVSKNLLEDL